MRLYKNKKNDLLIALSLIVLVLSAFIVIGEENLTEDPAEIPSESCTGISSPEEITIPIDNLSISPADNIAQIQSKFLKKINPSTWISKIFQSWI
jgi:hypothetical protein